jgi:predicted ATPase/DNA-binding SARP family transcriptional activator
MARLSLFLLGGFEAKVDEIPISGLKTDKARALLAYLAVEHGRPHRRQALAGLFWPGYLESSARASLRHALANLRQVLLDDESTAPCLLIEGETIQLNPAADVWVDVREFEAAIREQRSEASELRSGFGEQKAVIPNQQSSIYNQQSTILNLQSAISFYRGGFLEGFSLKDCPEFDTWTGIVREELQGKALTALNQLAGEYERQGELEKACQYTRRQLDLEPAREEAHRQLMRLLALRGQRTAALAQYETCKRSLAGQLGVEPSAETARLFEQIRAEEVGIVPRVTRADQGPAEPASLVELQPRPKHNLPIQLTSFIGREKEIAEVQALLSKSPGRLVTLTGPGGTGKTRLALQTAAGLLEQFADGVWLVNLAPLVDPEQIVQAVSGVFGLWVEAGRPLKRSLLDYLGDKDLLLLLDNCEHLIEACSRLTDKILRYAPKVHILASSREALEVEGEITFYVPSLSVPDPDHLPSIENILKYEAIRLFVERAWVVQPGFSLNEQNAASIAQICTRLDGIPLALELAAARVKVLGVAQLLNRLDDSFHLLAGGSRTVLPRHQTLRAAIDWSYNLLTEQERMLFRRLAVFSKSWTLEAAEVVCADKDEDQHSNSLHPFASAAQPASLTLLHSEVLDLLSQLINKSLVIVEQGEGGINYYRMLETVRQYAQERLEEAGEDEKIRNLHLQYYLQLAELFERQWYLTGGLELWKRLDDEIANVRIALGWVFSGDQGQKVEEGMRLASALWEFWYGRGFHHEGIEWIKKGLALLSGDSPIVTRLRAKGYWVASFLLSMQDNMLEAACLANESLALYQEIDDPSGLAMAQTWLGSVFPFLPENKSQPEPEVFARMRALGEAGLATCRKLDDPLALSLALFFNGFIAISQMDYPSARLFFEECLRLCQAMGNRFYAHCSMLNLGVVAFNQKDYAAALQYYQFGLKEAKVLNSKPEILFFHILAGSVAFMLENYDRMEQCYRECLEFSQEINYSFYSIISLRYLGMAALKKGELQHAVALLQESLSLAQKTGNVDQIYYFILYIGAMAIETGRNQVGAKLLGAVKVVFDSINLHLDSMILDYYTAAVRAKLGDTDFTTLWSEGQVLTLEQAIADSQMVGKSIVRDA